MFILVYKLQLYRPLSIRRLFLIRSVACTSLSPISIRYARSGSVLVCRINFQCEPYRAFNSAFSSITAQTAKYVDAQLLSRRQNRVFFSISKVLGKTIKKISFLVKRCTLYQNTTQANSLDVILKFRLFFSSTKEPRTAWGREYEYLRGRATLRRHYAFNGTARTQLNISDTLQFTHIFHHPSLQTIKTVIFHLLEIGVIGAGGGRITCGGQVKTGDHNMTF